MSTPVSRPEPIHQRNPEVKLAKTIRGLERRIRTLELERQATGGGGYGDVAAAVYDGYNTATDPVGERSPIHYTIADAGVSGDVGQVRQLSYNPIPPSGAHHWLRYVWYDFGFSASDGRFTIPQDGIYELHGTMSFSVINGTVDDCILEITSGDVTAVEVAHIDGPRNVAAGTADVDLNASGQAFLAAGSVVRMGFTIDLSGLTGLSSTTDVIWVSRSSRPNPPPTDSNDPGYDSRFSIAKVGERP